MEQCESSMEIELQYLYTGSEPLVIPVELAGFALANSASFDIRDSFFDTDSLALRRYRIRIGGRIRVGAVHQPVGHRKIRRHRAYSG